MEESRKALDDNKIDESEKEKITKEVIKLEKKISELKLKLNIGENRLQKSKKERGIIFIKINWSLPSRRLMNQSFQGLNLHLT